MFLNQRHSVRCHAEDEESQYLHHQDVVAVDAVYRFVCFPLQFSGQLHQDPAPVRHSFALQRHFLQLQLEWNMESADLHQVVFHNFDSDLPQSFMFFFYSPC